MELGKSEFKVIQTTAMCCCGIHFIMLTRLIAGWHGWAISLPTPFSLWFLWSFYSYSLVFGSSSHIHSALVYLQLLKYAINIGIRLYDIFLIIRWLFGCPLMHMYTERREQEHENTGWKIPMENQSQHVPAISAWEEEGGGSKAQGQPGRQ